LSGYSQTNEPGEYTVRTWQTDDGLPQNSVWAITQTPDGYLWVGTREGLARFDGLRFTVEDGMPVELKHGWITALCVGTDHSLWIGCDGYGVARLKDGTYTRFSEVDGLLNNQVRCLLAGRDGSIWIGSEGGVSQFKDGKFRNFAEKNGLASNSVRAMCEDAQGNIRIATQRGLSCLGTNGVISTFNVAFGRSANALKNVTKDRQGRIWMVSNEGLFKLEGEAITAYGRAEGLPDQNGTAAFEDRAGQLWVGTFGGLARMTGGKILPPPNREDVFGDLIYTIFEDRERNLWVGGQEGLYRLNPARFTSCTTRQGLSHNNVMSVREGETGTIWVGTWGGGLNRIQDGKITAYTTRTGLSHDSVLALLEGNDHSLWVGTDHGGGLNRFRDGPANLFDPPRRPGLLDAAIRVLLQDDQGALWIGTSRGLNILKDGVFSTYTDANGLAGNTVLSLLQRTDKSVWIGTDQGLSRWTNGSFTNYTTRDGLSANYINALYEDKNGTLWIGTRGGGLVRCQDGKFTAYTTKEGLFSDEIYEILEDNFGSFWMSCRRGIFRLSRKDLDDFDRGTVKVLSSTGYGRADGLATVQCNGVAKPAGWKGRDGRLWFATIRGVVTVDANRNNLAPPPVVIDDVLVGHRSVISNACGVTNGATITIQPGRGAVEIQYAALSYQAPEKNRFKYMLEGVDGTWVDAGTYRSVFYNNLAAGTYTFRVIACNNDGVWNETGAWLSLVFLPYFWQTTSFKVAVGVSVALLLGFLYRLRVARLKDIERLRIQIAANLHDDVGARLTKVAMVTEALDREVGDGQPVKPHVQNIFKTVREITQAMDEIVWTINPKNDTLDNLANYVFQYAQEYFQDTPIRCRLDVPAQLPDRAMSTGARHNLFMALKEALNNVLKHSGAGEVTIGIAVADGRMTIRIVDNGRGFDVAHAAKKGNGLENMRERLARIGGRLNVESAPGKGTVVELTSGS
jgi:signal transduction histidine kinase